MSKHFLFKSNSQVDDEDDYVKKQLDALGNVMEKKAAVGSNLTPSTVKTEPISEKKKDSFLEAGVVIEGSIVSATNIIIKGVIKGDVTCESDVVLYGTITGNVKAANVQTYSGKIHGDIAAFGSVTLSDKTVVNGNITANELSCDGRVSGNTKVKSKVSLLRNAAIIGDISADKMSVSEGAVIKGTIETGADKSENDNGKKTAEAKKPETEAKKPEAEAKKPVNVSSVKIQQQVK